MVYSVKGFRCIEKTSIYSTIILIVITYNGFNCINTQVTRVFPLKAKLIITFF